MAVKKELNVTTTTTTTILFMTFAYDDIQSRQLLVGY